MVVQLFHKHNCNPLLGFFFKAVTVFCKELCDLVDSDVWKLLFLYLVSYVGFLFFFSEKLDIWQFIFVSALIKI